MISFDAFRHDYIERYHPAAFEEIAARGVRASALIPSFPSKTFPNHYTLATGLYPGHHGIVGNIFYDPATKAVYRNNDSTIRDARWYSGEPIWATAERNGVKTGIYFWPGSEADIGGMRPSIWNAFDGKRPNSVRVDALVSWFRKPAGERPHLLMMYLNEVDDTTHKFGPDTVQTARAVADVDGALRRLLDSIAVLPMRDSVNIVLVSDHGMSTISPQRAIAVGDLLAHGGVDTTSIVFSDNGPVVSLWFDGDTTRLRRSYETLAKGLTNARVYRPSETPPRWHVASNPKFGDLILVAEDGFVLLHRSTDKVTSKGAHGWDPLVENMHGIFLAAGPGVRPLGIIPPLENVNVYPFVAALLRLERVPQVDGSLEVLSRIIR
ncbi:MAG: type phosphodiesterase/nucleotide pyrophosphatase [Gemmatimonadetes bacterium]|nr:type phosphodiesterase/nucleotide pyrophosphatase [Gemmatimonadota bacterium]